MPKRMWVNQPSTLQPARQFHGLNVLAVPEPDDPNFSKIYFLSGPRISARIPTNALSPGWKK